MHYWEAKETHIVSREMKKIPSHCSTHTAKKKTERREWGLEARGLRNSRYAERNKKIRRPKGWIADRGEERIELMLGMSLLDMTYGCLF